MIPPNSGLRLEAKQKIESSERFPKGRIAGEQSLSLMQSIWTLCGGWIIADLTGFRNCMYVSRFESVSTVSVGIARCVRAEIEMFWVVLGRFRLFLDRFHSAILFFREWRTSIHHLVRNK